MTTASMNPQERRICNFVKNNPGRTVLEIADAIDESPSTTKKRTPRLVEHGYLRKVGRRRPYGYRWTGKPFPEVILSWRDREQSRHRIGRDFAGARGNGLFDVGRIQDALPRVKR
ncbi:winged helix-turn-helix DNA-binding family protein [Burkholderia pseudomallei MSHR5608]|nr:winged helix-turn-helix DNA-binding family protein [Burkholderia pseudomallei MSHR5608]